MRSIQVTIASRSSLAESVDRSPAALAGVLAAVLADADPWWDRLPLTAI